MKDYQDFVDYKKKDFIKIYTKQEEKKQFREKIEKGEIEEVETKINIKDKDDFLKYRSYYAQDYWKALLQIYNCGWNDQSIKGYREESKFIIDNDNLLNFINKHSRRNLPFQFVFYKSAIQAYIGFKWDLKQQNKEIVKENKCDKEIIENSEIEGVKTPEPLSDKTIRIDINMEDIDEFLDYLENREPNRQQRKRYKRQIEELYQNGWNQYKHNTFIDDNRYRVNPRDIEVFVNGMKSRDFNVTVKEYKDTLELYLSYRWAKRYRPAKRIDKEEAIPPQVKIRKKTEESKKDNTPEGKKIFATINHYDSWKSRDKNSQPSKTEATTKYLGEVSGQRKSASMKNSVIVEDDKTVNIKMELNERSLISSNEENADSENSIEKQISKEKEVNKSIKQENMEGSEKNGNTELQASPTEEEDLEKVSDDVNGEKNEDNRPVELILLNEEEKSDKPTSSFQKRNRNKGWIARIIERIWLWFVKKRKLL